MMDMMVKEKRQSTQALGPELIPVSRQSARRSLSFKPDERLPLLFARPAVTFPTTERHRRLASTKLYCLVTEAHVMMCVNNLLRVVT